MMRDSRYEDEDDDGASYITSSEPPVTVIRTGNSNSLSNSSSSLPPKTKEPSSSSLAAARGVLDVASNQEASPAPSTMTGFFHWDNAKPWWTFGSGVVDKTVGPAWVPDDAATQCKNCSKTFDFFNRKHHCRYCGQIFCNACSSNYKLLPIEFGVREPQRTCGSCAAELEPRQDELARTMTNQTRQLSFDPDSPSKYLNAPVSFSMTAEISKAAHSIENIFGHVPNAMIKIDRTIPEALMKNAMGIAFLTVLKGGFFVSGKIGTGLVIAKLEQEQNGVQWSAPSAIGTMGIGWGAQIGGEITDFVIILTTREALETFSGASQVAVGAEMGISAGPFGRTAEASLNFGDRGLAPVYAYSQSLGLYAGVSLEGAVISARTDVNRRFYGKDFAPRDILSGVAVAPPRAALPLYQAVQKVFSSGYASVEQESSTASTI